MGDGEKLLTHFNSALKVLLGLDIFQVCQKKKLNFVDQCYYLFIKYYFPLHVSDATECLCIHLPSLVMALEISNHVGGTSVTNDDILMAEESVGSNSA